ncbi:hypothetical protein [Pontibacter sp. G13]|uniref:hypothetical protein n=1 Tax=Pontibacter sp. G13 TaxID=3074898 RepID=UPI00288B3446|nr:hypothetical protein [Pontibacter sp. G13]WNJ18485.1 hypothetical protein RJD25_26820 [Pontibacter sp. G13]
MSKKYTKKKLKLRSRASRRRFSLMTNPVTQKFKMTPERANYDVIQSLEAKVKAVQAAS